MRNKFLIVAVVAAILMSSATFVWVLATGNEPTTAGSQNDPLVSASYIDQRLMPRITTYINQRLAGVDTNMGASGDGFNQSFEVVEVPAGRMLMGYAGTEFILRAGSATIIASELGGISDTTNGVDLQHGVATPTNHLLIVPRSDGRGLNVTANALVMVRGRYSIR